MEHTHTKARSGFDLLMSVYITERRGINSNQDNRSFAYRFRYPRFDVFMFTLRSYAALPIDRAYLYVELSVELPDVRARMQQLVANATALFGPRLRTLQHRRLTTQHEWRQELNLTIAPGATVPDPTEDAQRLIFFLQNDDHPFVDGRQDVLREGLARLRVDQSRFKTLVMSHWSEFVMLIGKRKRPTLAGSFVHGEITQLDSHQIFNFGYLRHLLSEIAWTQPLKRLDEMVRMKQIYWPRVGRKYTMLTTDKAWQRMYVPLREQCRKFDAYPHARIPNWLVPRLELPPEANTPSTTLLRTPDHIVRVLSQQGQTVWTRKISFSNASFGACECGLDNGTITPIKEVVQRSVELYQSLREESFSFSSNA